MKTIHLSGILLLFTTLVFALVLANFNPSFAAVQNTAASISLLATPAPRVDSTSVIGSTNGIMLMGILITLIVILPVLFRRSK
jgi:hypothetical protein